MNGNAAQKLLERMRASPYGWGQNDFDGLLTGFGFRRKEGKKHRVYIHPDFRELSISIPRHNELKPCYARDTLKLIDELKDRLKK